MSNGGLTARLFLLHLWQQLFEVGRASRGYTGATFVSMWVIASQHVVNSVDIALLALELPTLGFNGIVTSSPHSTSNN